MTNDKLARWREYQFTLLGLRLESLAVTVRLATNAVTEFTEAVNAAERDGVLTRCRECGYLLCDCERQN